MMEWKIISLIGAFIISVITWCLNERSKRIYEEYKRKEKKYSKLISALKGFYISSLDKELRDEFLNQLNLCWMYCPDEVIIKAYNFLSTIYTDKKSTDKEKEEALGEFILSIRKDLIKRKPLKRTNLKPEDFKHLKAT
ncbi:MAG: hypothetical protein KKB09_07960 [Nanoarchaeota archaeon]|nr:hypothetical protein [Nanoarchaeota archaeon]